MESRGGQLLCGELLTIHGREVMGHGAALDNGTTEAVQREHMEHVRSTFHDRAVDERIQQAALDATIRTYTL